MANPSRTQIQEVLTPSEIKQVTSDLLSHDPELSKSNIEMVLEELAFLAASSMIFHGVISGALRVVGVDDGGLRVESADLAKRRLH